MRYCKFCGSELEDGAVFCGVCGKRQVSDQTPAPVQTPVNPDPMPAFAQGDVTVTRPAKRIDKEAGNTPGTYTSVKKKSTGIRTKEIAIVAAVAVLLVGGIAALAILKPGRDAEPDIREETVVAENHDTKTPAVDKEKITEPEEVSNDQPEETAETEEENTEESAAEEAGWMIPETVFYEDEGMTISVNEVDLKKWGPEFWVELKENRPYEYCTMELGGTVVINDCFCFPIRLSFDGNTTGTSFEDHTRLVDLCAVYGVDVKYMDIIFDEHDIVGDHNTIYYYDQDGSSRMDSPHIKGRVNTTDPETAKDKTDKGRNIYQGNGIALYTKWVDLESISRETPIFYDNTSDEREGLVITCETESDDQYARMSTKNYTGTAGSFMVNANGSESLVYSNGGASCYTTRPGLLNCEYFKFSKEGNDFESIRKSEDATFHIECNIDIYDKEGENKTETLLIRFELPFEHFD